MQKVKQKVVKTFTLRLKNGKVFFDSFVFIVLLFFSLFHYEEKHFCNKLLLLARALMFQTSLEVTKRLHHTIWQV